MNYTNEPKNGAQAKVKRILNENLSSLNSTQRDKKECMSTTKILTISISSILETQLNIFIPKHNHITQSIVLRHLNYDKKHNNLTAIVNKDILIFL